MRNNIGYILLVVFGLLVYAGMGSLIAYMLDHGFGVTGMYDKLIASTIVIYLLILAMAITGIVEDVRRK